MMKTTRKRSATNGDEAAHPLLGAAVALPDGGGAVLTGRLSTRAHPWPADHAVAGTAILPATAFPDLALSAAEATGVLSGVWPPPGAEPLDVAALYEGPAVQGYGYGPAFRGPRAVWRVGDAPPGERLERPVVVLYEHPSPASLVRCPHDELLPAGAGSGRGE